VFRDGPLTRKAPETIRYGTIVINAVASAVPAFLVMAMRVPGEQHTTRFQGGVQFQQHARRLPDLPRCDELGERLEVASRPAAKMEDRERRVGSPDSQCENAGTKLAAC
jgi:hypothetical protein